MSLRANQTPQTPKKRGSLVFLMVVLAVVGLGVYKRQALYDYARLYRYQPASEISTLADQTTMTPQARHDFYVNHPAVQTRDDFNTSCPDNGGEQTIVLGCYLAHQRGIYVFKVTDPQLNGVEQVTSAHEMLHAAYDRLSPKDREYVDGLLQDYYSHLQDKRLLTIFDAYKKTEPNDLTNEMHSIFGTEVATLPPALEAYYKQYFTDRQKVTASAAQYQGAFSTRKDLIAQYDQQLTSLKKQIDADQIELTTQADSLKTQRQELNSSSTSNATAYNAKVDSFNVQVAQYNALLTSAKARVQTYNQLVDKRNAIALEEQSLSQELNSRFQTQSAQ